MRDWTAGEIASMAARLRDARISAGFNRAVDAVRKFEWNYSRYMNYENAERAIPPKQAMMFAAAFHVTLDYIFFGKDDSLNQKEGIRAVIGRPVRNISLVALTNRHDFERIASGLEPMFASSIPIAEDAALPARVIFIDINDRSMSDPSENVCFEPGDRALIDLDRVPAPSDFVLALVPSEPAAVLRRYREVERDSCGTLVFELVPLNDDFMTIRVSPDNTGVILGVCLQHHRIRDLR